MKLKAILTPVLLCLFSSSAFAHLINYDSKPFLSVAQESTEKAAYIAHFCSIAADSVDDCMARLLASKGENAAEKCSRDFQDISAKFQERMDLQASTPRKLETARPHTSMLCTKTEVCHSYAYTDAARWQSGMKTAMTTLELAFKIAEERRRFESEIKERNKFLDSFLRLFKVEIRDSSVTNEGKVVMSQREIAKAFNVGFAKGWNDPWASSNVWPDVYFADGKKEVIGTDGKTYKYDPENLIPSVPRHYLKDVGPLVVQKASTTNNSFCSSIQAQQTTELTPLQRCYELEMERNKKSQGKTSAL